MLHINDSQIHLTLQPQPPPQDVDGQYCSREGSIAIHHEASSDHFTLTDNWWLSSQAICYSR